MSRLRHALVALRTALSVALVLVALLAAAGATMAAPATAPPGGVIGVGAAQLDAAHWIVTLSKPAEVILDRDGIAAQNRRLQQAGVGLIDIDALPLTLDAATVQAWLAARSRRPRKPLYDAAGSLITAAAVDGWMQDIAADAVRSTQPTRYGLIVSRASLRTFPTAQRIFNAPDDSDIDRFQETALFPGTPVVIAHDSRDGRWLFVVSDTYSAWVDRRAVAEGSKSEVMGYARKASYLVITGASVRTTYTPGIPQLSQLQLDMGVRVPTLPDWPGARAVNGQAAYASHVVELPVRDDDGRLRIVPALIPRTADVSPDYLPLTRANLIRQAFKFLGERYGWGHDYGARDCSGFIGEVYRSFGVLLPRNTGDQARSDALNRVALKASVGSRPRAGIVDALSVGDLVFIPGHVMLVIGRDSGAPYVIHDIQATAWTGSDGALVRAPLNGVSVTPLLPLRTNAGQRYVDRITDIQRIRP